MSKFSLNSLGKALAEKSGLSQMEAELFIRKMFDVCNQGLDQDKLVKMKWLGTFKVQAVKDRESINVNTGERIVIEGRDKLSFTPDNILKEIVNKPFAQFETVVVNDGVDFDAIDKKFEKEEEAQAGDDSLAGDYKSPDTSDLTGDTKVSADLKSDEQASVNNQQASVASEQARASQASSSTSEVIDFLDTDSPAEPSSDVIIIGGEQPEVAAQPAAPAIEQEKQPKNEANEEIKVQKNQEAHKQPKVQEEQEEHQEQPEVQEEQEEPTSDGRHLLIPRYMVVAASIVVVALIAGMGWFAFNYGKMAAQRDHLAMQLNEYHQASAKKSAPAQPAAQSQMTQEQLLRQKAIEDSIRMAQASEAVKSAEQAEELDNAEATEAQSSTDAKAQKPVNAQAKAKLATEAKAKQVAEAKAKQVAEAKAKLATEAKAKQAAEAKAKQIAEAKAKQIAEAKAKQAAAASSKYDGDARVRTGAYRITGVAEVVTVKAGQSIENISKRYLGPGMECYVEALNGTSTVKEGQKIKIPKLELKKKK